MLKTAFSLIALIFFFQSFSQPNENRIKYRSEQTKTVWLDKYGQFDGSTPWLDSITVIVIETDAKRISLYGSTVKTYDITTRKEDYVDGDYRWYAFSPCIDKDGIRCEIRIKEKIVISEKLYSFLYIDYKNVTYVYAMR